MRLLAVLAFCAIGFASGSTFAGKLPHLPHLPHCTPTRSARELSRLARQVGIAAESAGSRRLVIPTYVDGAPLLGHVTPFDLAKENGRPLKLENLSARVLARHGFPVEQNPPVFYADFSLANRRPDYRIGDYIFDHYAPRKGTPLYEIRAVLVRKVGRGQANRFVVNLSDSEHTAEELRAFLRDHKPRRIQQVFAVEGKTVTQVFPSL